MCSMLSQFEGDGFTDASAGPGDDSDFIFK
jgi:hypothetical protein